MDELEVIAAEAMKEARDDSSVRVYDSDAADEAAIKVDYCNNNNNNNNNECHTSSHITPTNPLTPSHSTLTLLVPSLPPSPRPPLEGVVGLAGCRWQWCHRSAGHPPPPPLSHILSHTLSHHHPPRTPPPITHPPTHPLSRSLLPHVLGMVIGLVFARVRQRSVVRSCRHGGHQLRPLRRGKNSKLFNTLS